MLRLNMTGCAGLHARSTISARNASIEYVDTPLPLHSSFPFRKRRLTNFTKAHQAYERGDGRAAHELSEEGKRHGAQMEAYNRQASEFIFRENNAPGGVGPDTIDLHGQFVEEAEEILD